MIRTAIATFLVAGEDASSRLPAERFRNCGTGIGTCSATVWNNTAKPQPMRVELPGALFVEAAGIDRVTKKRPELLSPQEISILIFE
jgi:hypothetical protein